MIDSNDLILVLNDYGIDGEKLIKNNPNVLAYADKNNVIRILDFLNEIGIKARNIEKCPSILYMKTDFEIKKVWDYLVNETELKKIDVDSCLHILNSNLDEVKKIYDYIVSKFGIDFLKKSLSVLARDSLNDVKFIVKVFEDTGHIKELTAGILKQARVEDVFEIIKLCEENNIKITGTIFQKSPLEIKEIIKVCEENNIEITGGVF